PRAGPCEVAQARAALAMDSHPLAWRRKGAAGPGVGTRRHRRHDALRIAIGRGRGTPASWPVSGLASWSVRLRPRRLPVLARCGPGQWRMRWRDSLTVAGAVPDWPWRDARGARGRL